MRITCAFATALALPSGAAHAVGTGPLPEGWQRSDFAEFCRFVADEYAYFDHKATDWPAACAHFAVAAQRAQSRDEFVGVLEAALGQLYDPHAHLGVHTMRSSRLVPSQAEVMAKWVSGRAVVADVRRGSAAEAAGLRPGDEVLAVQGVAVDAAAKALLPRFLLRDDPAAQDFALVAALAGRHDIARMTVRVRNAEGVRDVTYAPLATQPSARLTASREHGIGYVRIHDALGDAALVSDFDRALACLGPVNALVLDLRDTPSGGNTTVARGLMGRLIDRERPYQRHELVAEFRSTGIRRIWIEHVAPRGEPVNVPLVVLVGPWTGSMGEGLAIGLDAARGALVAGRPMARLLGALSERTLAHSQIVVRIPAEKLFHVDGRPREAYMPRPLQPTGEPSADDDDELGAAVALASKMASASAVLPPTRMDASRASAKERIAPASKFDGASCTDGR